MQARVWNDNDLPYSEMFKDQKITIPPKGYVEMEFYEAHEFKGRYSPIHVGADGEPMKSTYKMIRVEKIEGGPEDALDKAIACNVCGKKYESAKVLQAHVEEQHSDTPKAAQLEDAPRPRGRPRKEDA